MHIDVPSHVIGRPTRVTTVTLNASSTSATHINFVDLWKNNTTIEKMLSPYSYMRPTFEIQFLTRCSSTIYGIAMFGFYYGPETKPVPYSVQREAEVLSTAHTHIMPIASSAAITMNVPFVLPLDWLDISSPFTGELATAFVQSLGINTLEAGAESDVDIEVWVTCTDIQVQGFVAQATIASAGLVAGAATVGTKMYNTMDSVQQAAGAIRQLASKVKITENTNTAHNVVDGFPAYGASVGVKDAKYGDLNSLTRQVQLPRLTEMSVVDKVDPSIYGDKLTHSLGELASMGSYLLSEQFSVKGQIRAYQLETVNLGKWHRYILRHCRYWRGRPRIKLTFATSPLLAFRFQVSFSPTSFSVLAGTSDIPKMNFLVKGSEEVIIEIPFIAKTPVIDDQTSLGQFSIECTQLATALTTTGNASCYCVITQCMSPDTQYFSICAPKQVRYTGQSTRAIATEPISLSFASGPHHQTTLYDEIQTVEDIMTRWSTRDTTPGSLGALETVLQKGLVNPTAYANWGDNCDAFTCIYTLYRGSREFRIFATKAGPWSEDVFVAMPQTTSFVSQIGQLSSGAQHFQVQEIDTNLNTNVEFTAPWLAPNVTDSVYLTTAQNTFPLGIDTNLDTFSTTQFWSRAGIDYQVFILNMLPQSVLDTTLTPPV